MASALAVKGGPLSTIPTRERLIYALDYDAADDAADAVRVLGDSVSFYKVGLRLQFAEGGIDLARKLIGEGKKVFFDSKIYDIADQVRGAVKNIAKLNVHFLTVHGDKDLVEAAIRVRDETGPDMKIFAITLLTSMAEEDVRAMYGDGASVERIVRHRTKVAIDAKCDGVITSGLEAKMIRDTVGNNLLIVTPGIREHGVAMLQDDQKRVSTATDAIKAGADYVVIGRPIATANDIKAKAEEFQAEIAAAISG